MSTGLAGSALDGRGRHQLGVVPVRVHHGGSRAELEAELAEEGDPEIGYYHSYEITGAVNGPGVRFTLFLSGCPLRCQYCQNPDTWHLRDGQRVTTGRMVDEIGKYARFVTTAHGGITVSGGEPLLQVRFLEALLRRCNRSSVSTRPSTPPGSSVTVRRSRCWTPSTWCCSTSSPGTRTPTGS